MMFEDLFGWFQSYGLFYALLGLFIIQVIDATVFPALPELFAILAFLMDPTPAWGVMVLATSCLAEITGNSLLYFLVKRKSLPDFIQKAMKKWTEFIFVKDERIILINRIAPVVPFLGAFIATCQWDYRKSMLYLVIGGLAKYGALLALVGYFNYQFDPGTAQLFSLLAIIIIMALSFVSSYLYRKRIEMGEIS